MDRAGGATTMRAASIDIGTNTILLLIADIGKDGSINVVRDEQVIARLGKGVDENKIINRETFERAARFLEAYRDICRSMAVEKIFATGTSALRDAKNREEFCSFIKERVGIQIEILSGEDEAIWTFRGGISEFTGRSEAFSVIDIGGGSTEIITGTASGIDATVSIDMGSVRLTERILKQSPPEGSAVMEAYRFIRSQIPDDFSHRLHRSFVIGVAGTVTTLAALHQQLPAYDREKVSGSRLTIETIGSLFGLLKDKSAEQILAFPQIVPGRADILLAGIMILMGFMEKCSIPSITVSDRGLRYGILIRAMESSGY